jgi:hypothetical protein
MEVMAAIEGLNALKRPWSYPPIPSISRKVSRVGYRSERSASYRRSTARRSRIKTLWQKLKQAAGRHRVEWNGQTLRREIQ